MQILMVIILEKNIIIEQSDAVPEFLRTAKNLTAEDWKKLTEQVKSMKKDKKCMLVICTKKSFFN